MAKRGGKIFLAIIAVAAVTVGIIFAIFGKEGEIDNETRKSGTFADGNACGDSIVRLWFRREKKFSGSPNGYRNPEGGERRGSSGD